MADDSIAWIKAVLIDHRMHEPDCPIRQQQKANDYGGMFFYATGPCDCWVSND